MSDIHRNIHQVVNARLDALEELVKQAALRSRALEERIAALEVKRS